MVLSGKTLILGLSVVIVTVALAGYKLLHDAAHLRFAIGVYAEPRMRADGSPDLTDPDTLGPGNAEIEGMRRIPLHHSIIVRIEKASAGRSARQALALLLTQDGVLLFPPQVLTIGKAAAKNEEDGGAPTEQTRFPPIDTLPPQGLLSAVVVRVPQMTPAAISQLTAATREGGPVHLTYSRLLSIASGLSGSAEMVTTEMRSEKGGPGSPGRQ